MKIKIKPLSVNEVWVGRRFKTPKYKSYEEELMYRLPNVDIPTGELQVTIEWGFSSKSADIDNPTKPFLDILQKKYGFNDKRVDSLNLTKVLVKKGEEYIDFVIRES